MSKRTKEYFQTKLSILEEAWNRFDENYAKIQGTSKTESYIKYTEDLQINCEKYADIFESSRVKLMQNLESEEGGSRKVENQVQVPYGVINY